MNDDNVKILGLCPLKPELQSLVTGLEANGLRLETIAKNKYWCEEYNLLLTLGGHGKAEFAARASAYLSTFPNCDFLFCLGTAGNLSEELKPLDVVVAKLTLEHDYNEMFGQKKSKPQFKGAVTEDSFQVIAEQVKDHNFRTLYATVASGDEDIVTQARADEIHQQGAIAVAWEGAGGARAARNLGRNYIEIRAISDDCNEHTASHFWENLPLAMKNLSVVFTQVLIALK